jgi:hypothetical protein
VIFLGSVNEKQEIIPTGTGFLVIIKSYFHVVTAKHVIFDKETDSFIDDEMFFFFNNLDGTIGAACISDLKNRLNSKWIFHENSDVDIGVMPFGFDPSINDLVAVQQEVFMPFEQLSELRDIFFISYQPGIQIRIQISPIIRAGTISVMNDDGTFYIDAAAFPGNSGSPVFLRPSFSYDEKEVHTLGGGNFIGVIGGYLTYEDVAYSMQTKRPRIAFEENTGLSRVWSTSFINEIGETMAFQQQLDKIPK